MPSLFEKESKICIQIGDKVTFTKCILEKAPEVIYSEAKANDITMIKLIGSKAYLSNIKTRLEEKSIKEYNYNKFDIEII